MNEKMVVSHPKTAVQEIRSLKMMLNNVANAIIQWNSADTANQSRVAQKRMVDMANGVKSLKLGRSDGK